jgi:putative transposase
MIKQGLKSHFHCVYNLQYHLVLVTKYRRKCFTQEILDFLKDTSEELCQKWDCRLVEFGGEEDHIHLLISCHPSMQMSIFVNNLKTVTSRLTRKKFETHLKKYFWKPVLWTRAYCLLTAGGATIETIKKYIENQGQHSSPSNLQSRSGGRIPLAKR